MSNTSSIKAAQEGSVSASFHERSIWIQLISQLVGLGGYAAFAGSMLAEGVRALPRFYPVFALAVALIVVANVAGHAVAAIASRPEGRDERDRIIGWRAAHGSGWVLGLGTVVCITALMIELESVWVAHLLLLFLFLSEVLACVLKLAFYRRSI